jgi:hypothetical protein
MVSLHLLVWRIWRAFPPDCAAEWAARLYRANVIYSILMHFITFILQSFTLETA